MPVDKNIISDFLKCLLEKDIDAAEQLKEQVVLHFPTHPQTLLGEGVLHFLRREYKKSCEKLQQAEKIAKEKKLPASFMEQIYYQLAVSSSKLQQWDKATKIFNDLLAAYPDNVSYKIAYSAHLCDKFFQYKESHIGLLEEAKENYENIIKEHPKNTLAIGNLAITCRRLGLYDKAVHYYHRALEIDGDDNEVFFNLSHALFLSGDSQGAWTYHKNRWNTNQMQLERRNFLDDDSYQEWRGQPLTNKKLLIYGEQGLGDQIMFLAMIPLLKSQLYAPGSRVYMTYDKRLKPLYERSFPTIIHASEFHKKEQRLLDSEKIDYYIAMGDLPAMAGFFYQCKNTVPYLKADDDKIQKLTTILKDKARGRYIVGLSWRSFNKMDAGRNIDLHHLLPLFRRADILFVNFQYGKVQGEIKEFIKKYNIDNFIEIPAIDDNGEKGTQETLDCTDDIDGLAAAISAVDYVLSIAITTAHLAGALGVPCRNIVSFVTGWPWVLTYDKTSPWYPSMRLFRQKKHQEWANIVSDIQTDMGDALPPLPPSSYNK